MTESTRSTPGEFSQSDIEIQSRDTLHDGFMKLERLQLRHQLHAGGWSNSMQRELVIRDDAVGVLLFDPNLDKVVLVRQFRVGVIDQCANPWLLELVAGMVKPEEVPEQVAIRESQEEANCTPTDLIRICEYFNSPGTTNEKLTLFCGRVDARSAGGIHGLREENEDIEVVVLDLSAAIEALASGAINNAMTLIAIQWLQLHKSAVLEAWK